MTFPAYVPTEVAKADYGSILRSLSLSDDDVEKVFWSDQTRKLLLVVPPSFPLKEKAVDVDALGAVDCRGVRGVALTQRAECGFASRYFSPWNGVGEDPVNGSSHTALIPLWAAILGKNTMTALALSQRGGRLECKLLDSTVEITGDASIVFAKGVLDPRILT